MSLEEVMAWVRKSGDIDVILYETGTSFQVCVDELPGLRRRSAAPAHATAEALPARPQGRRRGLAALHDPAALSRQPVRRGMRPSCTRPGSGISRIRDADLIFPGQKIRIPEA